MIAKVLAILNGDDDVGLINQTHIVLIPKKKNCESPVDFYKLFSKVLANRLKVIVDVKSLAGPGST